MTASQCAASFDSDRSDSLRGESCDTGYLKIPSLGLDGFTNTDTSVQNLVGGKSTFVINGHIDRLEPSRICPDCGHIMHIHGSYPVNLLHLPFGSTTSSLHFPSSRLICPHCRHTEMQSIPFKSNEHRITRPLQNYIESLLASNRYTLKDISVMTGVNRAIIKDIDKKRLLNLYTVEENGVLVLKRVEGPIPFLGIDEFLLHRGNKYATHIIDQQTGAVLWIAEGKKKQVVFDFIDHYGLEWMEGVQAVACDMNSDFEQAFRQKCPHIAIVYDHFHIVKNFNDKVINEVRKEEQKRLEEEGDIEGAKSLKKSRFILTSNRATLQRRDQEAEEGREIRRESELFNTPAVQRRGGQEERYDSIIATNRLLFAAAFIKEKLSYAYTLTDKEEMLTIMNEIISLCEETENRHFLWFARLLRNHLDGIVSHAVYRISAGKIEGVNNRIKTIRRQAYGLPDDEYFFLKIIDMSRNSANEKSN